jgi:lysozyme family protein
VHVTVLRGIVTIVAALAAISNSALADVTCNSKAVHYKTCIISATEKDGFADTIDEVCSDASATLVQKQSESTVFSRTRTADTFNREICMLSSKCMLPAGMPGAGALSRIV